MLNKKFSACVLALSVLLSPSVLTAQNVKVQTGPAVTLAPGLGAAGSVPSIQLTNVSLASPLATGISLAAPLYPALTVAPALAVAPLPAAAVQPKDLSKPFAAVQPVAPQKTGVRGVLNSVKNSVGALFSRKESAPKTDAPDASGSSMFDGSRKLLATVLTAAIVCAGGCSKDPVEPMYDGGYPHMDDRYASAVEVAAGLNNTLDASEAYAAKVAFNTWDTEYHVGVPHRNDFDLDDAHYAPTLQMPFNGAVSRLGELPVDQAVGTKLVYVGGSWVMLVDGYRSDYWVSEWRQVPDLYSAQEAQDQLNVWLTSSEAFDAKLTGDDHGVVRLTYPVDPLSNASYFYWDMATFDTYLEAMTWSLEYLDAAQNRGMKIFFSPYDVNYVVLYPIETAAMSQKLGVSQSALESAIGSNSESTPMPANSALRKGGRTERVTVDWKGVFSTLKKQAPAPLRPAAKK